MAKRVTKQKKKSSSTAKKTTKTSKVKGKKRSSTLTPNFMKSEKKASPSDKKALQGFLDKILQQVASAKKTTADIEKKIDVLEKKMFSSKKVDNKFQAFYKMEELKLSKFSQVEKNIKAVSPLLNKSYALCLKLGGIVQEDFLTLCQDLAKGFDLNRFEKDIKRIRSHLRA